MANIFVSHSSLDETRARRVFEALRRAGYDVFLDVDPDAGIAAGQSWEQEIYGRLRRCDAVVCIVTAAFVRSRWCFAEVALARSVGRPVFPLVLDRDAVEGLSDVLGGIQHVYWEPDEEAAAMERLAAGLRRRGLAPEDELPWDTPYPGFRPFDAGDAGVFFGRSSDVRRLTRLLEPSIERDAARFVAVAGASGSGKSSLVRAGLVPKLTRRADWRVLPPIVPGGRPLDALARALVVGPPTGSDGAPALAERLDAGGAPELLAVVDELLAAREEETNAALLVVDQFEQLVTQGSEEQTSRFLDLLRGALAAQGSPLRAVVTVRSEYVNEALRLAAVEERAETYLVTSLDRHQLRDVIEGPARRAGIELEAGLVDRLVDDSGGGDALPLLAYTLWLLADEAGLVDRTRPEDRRITLAHYEAVGGVRGALRDHADRLLEQMVREGRGSRVIPTLLRLVRMSGRREITSRRVPLHEFENNTEREVVAAFVDASLLRTDDEGDRTVVEVAHEALLEHWRPLRDAIDQDLEFQLWRGRLARDVAAWERSDREDAGALLGGARLREAERWLAERREDLRPVERELIERSVQRRDATRRRQRWALTAGLVVATGLALLSASQWMRAESEGRVARSRLLADRATAAFDESAEGVLHAAALATESLASDWSFEGMAILTRALDLMPLRPLVLRAANAAAFGPDGSWLVAVGPEGRAVVLDAASGVPLDSVDLGAPARSVAASPKGVIAAGGYGVYLWDRGTGRSGAVLETRETVWDLDFIDDGRSLVVAGEGPEVRFLDVETGRPRRPIVDTGARAMAAELVPGGEVLLTGGPRPALWDAGTGEHLLSLGSVLGGVRDLAFLDRGAGSGEGASDLRLSVAHGGGMTLLQWPPGARGLSERSLDSLPSTRLDHGAQRLAVHAGEAVLASGGRVWSWNGPRVEELWRTVQPGDVWSVSFSPDGRRLATAGSRLRIWSLGSHSERHRLVGAPVAALAVAPDGDRVAVAREDSTLQILSTSRWEPVAETRSPHPLTELAFDADGERLLVTGGRTASVLDGSSGGLLARTRMDEPVTVAAFSPGGRWLIVASYSHLRALASDGWATAATFEAPVAELGRPAVYARDIPPVAFSADERLLRAHIPVGRYEPGEDWVWRVDTGERVAWRLYVDSLSPGMARSTFERAETRALGATEVIDATDWRDAPLAVRPGISTSSASAREGPWSARARDHGVVLSHDGTPNDSILLAYRDSLGHPPAPSSRLDDEAVIALDPRGRWLAVAGGPSPLRVWPLQADALIENACRRLPRLLSDEEWREYLGELAPERSACARALANYR